jgi:hypothetical protein
LSPPSRCSHEENLIQKILLDSSSVHLLERRHSSNRVCGRRVWWRRRAWATGSRISSWLIVLVCNQRSTFAWPAQDFTRLDLLHALYRRRTAHAPDLLPFDHHLQLLFSWTLTHANSALHPSTCVRCPRAGPSSGHLSTRRSVSSKLARSEPRAHLSRHTVYVDTRHPDRPTQWTHPDDLPDARSGAAAGSGGDERAVLPNALHSLAFGGKSENSHDKYEVVNGPHGQGSGYHAAYIQPKPKIEVRPSTPPGPVEAFSDIQTAGTYWSQLASSWRDWSSGRCCWRSCYSRMGGELRRMFANSVPEGQKLTFLALVPRSTSSRMLTRMASKQDRREVRGSPPRTNHR